MPALDESFLVAVEHYRAGRREEAEKICQQIIAVEPAHADAWNLLGVIAFQKGQDPVAIERLSRALQLDPNHVHANNNLGTVYKRQGNLAAAIACHRRAVELAPHSAEALNNLGTAWRDQGDVDEAVRCFRRAIDAQPAFPEAHFNLGVTLQQDEQLDQAADCFRQAIELRPGFKEARFNLGVALKDQGRFEEAADCFRRAAHIAPDNPDAVFELGRALHGLGRRDEAMACYRRSLNIDPDHASAHLHQAMLLLAAGDFEHGWAEYEWRWRTGKQVLPQFSEPPWNGEELADKTILLVAEQGLGDTIQFIRYAPLLKRLGATVAVQCQRPLPKLLASCVGIDQLAADGESLPPFDFYAPLLSLPRIFNTTLETIPATVPYLSDNASLVAEWREKLDHVHGFRIGINWHGSAGGRRDIPLNVFGGLAQFGSVQLISLQNRTGLEQLGTAGTRLPIIDLGEFDVARGAFIDTAAIMKNLDLVITSDTSVAHLAGALGVPVWIALPHVPDWRWLLDRSDSPWYPTMRLFRQPRPGDWASVFIEISAALKDILRHANGVQ